MANVRPSMVWLWMMAMALPAWSAWAELSDPSQPPASVSTGVVKTASQPDHAAGAPASTPASGPRWQLSMIRLAPGQDLVVINGQQVATGHDVDGLTVEHILPGKVQGKSGGETVTLTLLPEANPLVVKKLSVPAAP